jgi:hypothetical protein
MIEPVTKDNIFFWTSMVLWFIFVLHVHNIIIFTMLYLSYMCEVKICRCPKIFR